MDMDGVRGVEPHWKVLLRDAQQAELAATNLRVERMRVVRAADEFCAKFASLSPTDSAVGCQHLPDTDNDTNNTSAKAADTAGTPATDNRGPGQTSTVRTMKTAPRGSSLADQVLGSLPPRLTPAPLTQPLMAEVAVAATPAAVQRASNATPSEGDTSVSATITAVTTQNLIATTPMNPASNTTSENTVRVEWSTERLISTLSTLDAPWMERVAALSALASGTQEVDAELAAALAVQLLDLRSKVVVAAAEAVAGSANRIPVENALVVARAALDGVAANKQVMYTARARAHAAVLAPHAAQDAAWEHVREHAPTHPTERARVACVRATTVWASAAPAARDEFLAAILRAALEDKAQPVRDAGRALWLAYTRHEAGRIAEMRKQLGTLASRLPDATKSSKRTSVRDLVRKRRAQQARLSEPT